MLLAPSRDKLSTDKRTQEASLFECRAVRKPRCMGVEVSVGGKQRRTSPASQRHQGCSNWDTLYQCLKQGSGKSLRERVGTPHRTECQSARESYQPRKVNFRAFMDLPNTEPTCQTPFTQILSPQPSLCWVLVPGPK